MEPCTLCSNPLTITDRGTSCSACGDTWTAPYFLRAVVSKWNAASLEFEQKLEAKEAKRLAKAADHPVNIGDAVVEQITAVNISPSVAAYFTDDVAVIGKPLEYKCEKCHKAPRRHPDFANKWKWKTAKGFEGHKCLG